MTASYEYHIGVDYQKTHSHPVVQDSSGKTLRSGRVKNNRQSSWRVSGTVPSEQPRGCRSNPQLDGDLRLARRHL